MPTNTASGLNDAEMGLLVRDVEKKFGVSLTILVTRTGTKNGRWDVIALAYRTPIMRDGVLSNWYEIATAVAVGRSPVTHNTDLLSWAVYWSLQELWQQLEKLVEQLPLEEGYARPAKGNPTDPKPLSQDGSVGLDKEDEGW